MKTIVARETGRKLKVNPHQPKDAQSQSPNHKKLLRKIEMIHKEPSYKNDLSLKENLLTREPEEEVVEDFRVEIERRYKKATANHTFRFPLKEPSVNDSAISSLDDSFESLKHVTTYDLSTQNKKKRFSDINQAVRMTIKDDGRALKSASIHGTRDLDLDASNTSREVEEEESSGVPLELRIRDKTSATYQKLLKSLDEQLGRAHQQGQEQPLPNHAQQQTNQEQRDRNAQTQQTCADEDVHEEYNRHVHTDGQDVEVHKLDQQRKRKERNVKSQGRHERTPYNFGELLKQAKANINNSGTYVKKNLSYEKVAGRGEPSSALERTMGQLNISSSKGEQRVPVDLSKMPQESFKKLFNSNILKSITPQYNKSQQMNTHKENVFKTYTQDSYPTANTKTPLTTLYQKAKNEILNHKLKVNTANPARYHVKNTNTSMSATKRGDTPTDMRKIAFNNFYGSPDVNPDKSSGTLAHSSQNLAKKDSVRTFQVQSPFRKPNDAVLYASYDNSSQAKIAKKPGFKLDIQKRTQAYRDALSSARTRKKGTPDKYSEGLSTESAVRMSYDVQQYTSVLNNSTQKNTSKKHISFMPGASTAKNLSFTKTFFSYK